VGKILHLRHNLAVSIGMCSVSGLALRGGPATVRLALREVKWK